MIVIIIMGLYIPTVVNYIYMYTKRKKLHLEFDQKIKNKGYEKTDVNEDLVFLISDEVVDNDDFAARVILSMFPVLNLYPFIQIITKKLDKEYKTILDNLDNQKVLACLEKNKYIYNQNTILKIKENIVNKMDEINKISEYNINTNKQIKISQSDSLEQLKEKKALLDEMIYLQNLDEMEQILSHQEYEENKSQDEKPKQLKLTK